MEEKKIIIPREENLLDRENVPRKIAEDLAEPISYLNELADFGVQLLKRSFHASSRKIPDVVLLVALFRQVLAFVDGVHIHLMNGAVHTSLSDLRA